MFTAFIDTILGSAAETTGYSLHKTGDALIATGKKAHEMGDACDKYAATKAVTRVEALKAETTRLEGEFDKHLSTTVKA